MGRKPRKCRICKKRPVWKGGDVKNPGPVCKKCYHKNVWPERVAARQHFADDLELLEPCDADEHYDSSMDPDYDWRSIYGNNA
jgi:hypothetical protein